jgi:hypothetical protein
MSTPLAPPSRASLTIAAHHHCKDAGMPDGSTIVYARGSYRVIRLDDDDASMPFRIFDTAGAELSREAGFDDAREWVDARVAGAVRIHSPARRTRR